MGHSMHVASSPVKMKEIWVVGQYDFHRLLRFRTEIGEEFLRFRCWFDNTDSAYVKNLSRYWSYLAAPLVYELGCYRPSVNRCFLKSIFGYNSD